MGKAVHMWGQVVHGSFLDLPFSFNKPTTALKKLSLRKKAVAAAAAAVLS